MSLTRIRKLCLVILPLLLFFSIMLHFWLDVGIWSDYFYIISLTANIGYFTNFIAIKMLFKPYNKTAFGRQGLIPKNQAKLASALSATLNDHFLTSEHWTEYLQHTKIIPKLLDSAESFCLDWLNQPQNIQQLKQSIGKLLEQNESELQQIFEKLQTEIVAEFSSDFDINQLLGQGFSWIEKQFQQRPTEMMFMIEPVIKTLAENIPEIAERLVITLDRHIENQDLVKRSIAKAARWSANLSEDEIKEYLFRLVASAEFRETLFNGLQNLLSEYKTRPELFSSSHQMLDFKSLLESFIQQQSSEISISQLIGDYLNHPQNNQSITSVIQNATQSFFIWLNTQLNHSQVEKLLIQQMVRLIETIDLREIVEEKAAKFSPKQMENIFKTMISDQLVFIELLGALLGALSGLALIDLRLFAILSGLLMSYFGLDYYLTNKKQTYQKS